MEGKLYKSPNGEHYYLTVNGQIFAEIDGHPLKSINQALSLKNCEAIENGYDLDEIRKLADEDFECELGDGPTTNESINSMIKKSNTNGAEWGFLKAIEILGDKKFDMNDIALAFRAGIEHGLNPKKPNTTEYVQSLQTKEWDVEICCYIGNGDKESDSFKDPLVTNTGIPKLDNNGCLILRRI